MPHRLVPLGIIARRLGLVALLLTLALASPAGAAEAAISVEEVEEEGLYGRFFRPAGGNGLPAVVVIGGSESGIGFAEPFGPALVEEGFAVLALPYHNYRDLPQALEQIPLEYFDRAIAWLRAHPATDPERVGLVGHSRGGEGALLVASRNAAVRAVVASVPGAYTAPAVNLCTYPALAAAWSAGGEPLLYLPTERKTEPKREDESWPEWLERTAEARTADARAQSWEAIRAHPRFASVAIPVEEIAGPVLLLSAGRDDVWASGPMAAYLAGRLREHGFPHPVVHAEYPEAGHLFFSPPGADPGPRGTPACSLPRGGDPEPLTDADRAARAASWELTVAFLRAHLAD